MTKRATLTGKQQAFVDAYFATNFNGVRAAKMAGYAGNYNVLGVAAYDNLRNPKIRAVIDKRMRQMIMGADEVLTRLTAIARADFGDLTDEDGNVDVKLAKERGVSFLIKEQEFTEKFIPVDGKDDIKITTAKIKLHDPMRALEMLGKHHKVFDRALETDWRQQLIDAGLDPDKVVESAADQFEKLLKAKESVKNGAE